MPQDFTAIAVLERTKAPHPNYPNQCFTHYAVRRLQRFPPGTPYAEIAAILANPRDDLVLAIAIAAWVGERACCSYGSGASSKVSPMSAASTAAGRVD
jgi:hypothetical protein